jgi:putative redox protein
MAIKHVAATLDGDGLRLLAWTGSGHLVVMDDTEGDSGPRPAELLVVAQAGCTAMDVVSILRKKRQVLTRYEVRVTAEQRDDPPPHVFEVMRIVHVVDGNVSIDALRRSIELSATRYCTVTGNLGSGVTEIHHAYLLRDEAGHEHHGEVVVTGPAARQVPGSASIPSRATASEAMDPGTAPGSRAERARARRGALRRAG